MKKDIVEELLNESRYNSRARPQADTGKFFWQFIKNGRMLKIPAPY